MRVGGVEETLTVTGAAPVVDVQTAVRRDVITNEQVESLPTGRMYSSIAQTLPAVNLSSSTRSMSAAAMPCTRARRQPMGPRPSRSKSTA